MAHKTFLQRLFRVIWIKSVRLLVRAIIPILFRSDNKLATTLGIHKQRITFPSRDPGRTIKANLFYPNGFTASTPPQAPLPVLLNWHGSGFIFPLLDSDNFFCAKMAKEGLWVLDCDYRKAPENPYPLPVEDVEDALLYIASQPKKVDLSRVAVSGFSAGGNLALVAASALRKKLADMLDVKVAIAIYPLSDLSIPPEEKKVEKPIKDFKPKSLHMFSDCYVPDESLRTDPHVSPGLAPAEEFPQSVVMITAEGDNLGPEGRQLAERLDDGKRKVVNWVGKDLWHGFDKLCKKGSYEAEQRDVAYGLCVDALKEGFGL